MSAVVDVPAALIAVNVKPQRLSGDVSLMQTVPLRCSAESFELLSRQGIALSVSFPCLGYACDML